MTEGVFIVQLNGYQDLSAKARSFELLSLEQDFHFEPGQFVSMEFELDGQQYSRSYSLSSPPGDGRSLEILVKYNPTGPGSHYLWGMEIGFRFPIKGPHGSFVLDRAGQDSILIATGTGIAPLRSMLYTILQSPSRPSVTLLFGARTEPDLLYHSEFTELAAKTPNFSYCAVLSQASDGWPGARGYVQDHLDAALTGRNSANVYIAGSIEMVKDVRLLLEEKGWDPGRIHFEK